MRARRPFLLFTMRRASRIVAAGVAHAMVLSLWPALPARAEPAVPQPAAPSEPVEVEPELEAAPVERDNEPSEPENATPADQAKAPATSTTVPGGPSLPAEPEPGSRNAPAPLALPTGADKSGVTSKSISVPKGSGTIKGMEESFSAQLSTGIATFTVPIALPQARGDAQPSLALTYSSSGGSDLAGMGWQIGVPFIARQTDRGVPRYEDSSDWHPNQDRFVFNGGQELVPICKVAAGGSCAGALQGEEFPAWAVNHQYFRPRVEGSFLRFFWSEDHLTWRVQDKSGVTMELGVPLDGSGYALGLERNPDNPAEVFKWHLVRQYDTYGNANPASGLVQPANLVVYRYAQDGGMAYLTDIFDTSPVANPLSAPLSEYAHHTRLAYELRTDPTRSYRSGWEIQQTQRLARIDVSAKAFDEGTTAARHLVRRYHLSYDAQSHVSLLASVQVEGRCASAEDDAAAEGPDQTLPSTNCPRLPPMQLGYAHVEPKTTSGAPVLADLPGYEGFDESLRAMTQSPPHSVDEEQADLFDVNSDGLPDVLVTSPGVYGPGHGVFFNGVSGTADAFGAALPMGVGGVLGADASTISLKNLNVAALDLDGDATIDLLHMPKVKSYGVYAPVQTGSTWAWQGRSVTTASGQSPKIDFGKDALETQVMDVDFDGLVDVVVSTGTEMQTFFALGRFAAGDGQFGNAHWTGAASASVSNDPVTACVPWSATPIRFSDSDVKVADMNGDGIPDIVRVRKGDIRYWPGRGNGFWGTGQRDDCPGGTYGSNRHVAMTPSPQFSDIQGDSLRLDDVNGDGLTDLVQIRFDEVDLWLNVDGAGWTERHIIQGTPASPAFANRVRLVDVNGSGTRDILWGNAGNYRYIDLQGGERPWLLTEIDNGLGKTTAIEYSTSTAEMLAAEAAGDPWATRMPTVAHVVKRVVESNGIDVAGQGVKEHVTEYSYRDPVFEGRQREFRGFTQAEARRIGDANSPTDITETTFLLGECEDETPENGIDECSVSERWRDNPREALKGLPVVTERRNEAGAYLSTDLTTYRLRNLYTGRDGREVRHAFEERKDSYLYDVADFQPQPSTLEDHVLVNLEKGGSTAVSRTLDVALRSTAGRAHVKSESTVDFFGNRTHAKAYGCIEGCPGGADELITTETDALLVPENATGWLWRTGGSRVIGDDYFLGTLRDTEIEYSPEGDPVTTTVTLADTIALDRFHAESDPVADPPADASEDGTIESTNTYDELGNLERETGPNGRCRDVLHDELYGALPTTESVWVNGCDSGQPLSVSAAYDRGLGLVTTVVDMQGQPTYIGYDSFGRLATLHRPHPETVSAASPEPSVTIEYFLPPDLPSTPFGPARHSIIHTSTQDGALLTDTEYLESWSYVDGFGRTLVTLNEADTSEGDAAALIAADQVVFDAKGAVAKKHLQWFYSGSATAFPLGSPPPPPPVSPSAEQIYDAFDRQIFTKDLDGTITLASAHHALSTDLSDAADLTAAVATEATERRDGHGRVVSVIERIRDDGIAGGSGTGTVRERETRTTYLPTGEPHTITRQLLPSGDEVIRWMRYDSLGRLVLNVEPNTTENFDADPETDPTPAANGLKAWRYAYNDAGDLVGTSDARGCGVNFAYDGAGRLINEDYSPCTGDHPTYSEPNLGARTGIEVLYRYDTQPPSGDYPSNFFSDFSTEFLTGRLVAVYDRASLSVTAFDGRGRAPKSAVRVATPGVPDDDLDDRYAPRWYQQATDFDSADREVLQTTGATDADLLGAGSASNVTTTYSNRGTVASAGSSYGTLVTSTTRSADGLLEEIVYGDLAATATGFLYDSRRRLTDITTARATPSEWTETPAAYEPDPNPDSNNLPTFQTILQDDHIEYDVVSNPVEISDLRDADEWPATAKPVSKEATYDDFYRIKSVDYTYEGDDTWDSPFAAENSNDPDLADPRRAKPSPHVDFAERVHSQTFDYDWLGNTSATDDDANGFYDRSLGTITNGAVTGSDPKPYQLVSATNESQTPVSPEGNLAVLYDAAGNLTRMNVRRRGTCLPSGSECNQRFAYTWDEVGRLVRARRWDVTAGNLGNPGDSLPGATPDADLTYAYDAADERVLKTASDGVEDRYTVYIFPSLELRRAEWISYGGMPEVFDYELTELTEVPYLFANDVRLGRVVYEPRDGANPIVPTPSGWGPGDAHVFLELGDHLGSTSVVLDHATGELVERTTYQAYGGGESSYRPERWKAFREDYGFTGKEEDVEVGLAYFGKRFYAASLNRWVSPDPLEIHTPRKSGEANVYAYVSGQALKAVDPFGLAGQDPARPCGGMCTAASQKAMKLMERRSLPTQFFKPAPTRFGILPEDYAGEGLYFRGRISMKESSWRSLGPSVRRGMGALTTWVHEATHRSLSKMPDTWHQKARAQLYKAHADRIEHRMTTTLAVQETAAYQVEHWARTYMSFAEKIKTPERYGGLYELSKQYEASMGREVRAGAFGLVREGKDGKPEVYGAMPGRVGLSQDLRNELLGTVFPGVTGNAGADFARMRMDPKMVQLADAHFRWIEAQHARGNATSAQTGQSK